MSLTDIILVKIFATALALNEVTTQPQAVKTHFDPMQDHAQVVQILRDGCAHMRQASDNEWLERFSELRPAVLLRPLLSLRAASSLPRRCGMEMTKGFDVRHLG
jgi:hypothetical protein